MAVSRLGLCDYPEVLALLWASAAMTPQVSFSPNMLQS